MLRAFSKSEEACGSKKESVSRKLYRNPWFFSSNWARPSSHMLSQFFFYNCSMVLRNGIEKNQSNDEENPTVFGNRFNYVERYVHNEGVRALYLNAGLYLFCKVFEWKYSPEVEFDASDLFSRASTIWYISIYVYMYIYIYIHIYIHIHTIFSHQYSFSRASTICLMKRSIRLHDIGSFDLTK